MSMEEWKEFKLGEIGAIVGGATPSTTDPSNYDGDISWITPKDLSTYEFRYIEKGGRMITKAGFDSCSCKMLPAGSILFSSRAPIGYVAIAKKELCTNQGFKSIIPNKEKVNNIFLYYLLLYNKSRIESLGSGTTFKEVSGSVMKDVVVSLPNLPTQNRIASILSSLDDKIEVNRRINENLEQQAQALFKSWFVDFEPFRDGEFVESELGMIPKGWRVGKIGDIATIVSGKRPANRASIKTEDSTIPLIGASCIMGYTSDYLYESKILVTGRVGTHGVIMRFNNKCWPSDNTLVIQSKYYEFVYQCLRGVDYKNLNRGSTQPLITQKDLKNVNIVIPTLKLLNEYENNVSTLMTSVSNLEIENDSLAQLRDALLPRLMSGELNVNEIEA